MARAGILYSDVVRAAEQIRQSGEMPTVDRVRIILGNTGSKSTIAPMLKQWKEEHTEEMATSDSGLPQSVVNAIRGVYELIKTEAENTIKETQIHCEQQLSSKDSQLITQSDQIAALEAAKQLLQKQVTEQLKNNQMLDQQLHQSKLKASSAESDNQGMKNRLADNEKQLDALHHQLHSARTQFEHFQEASAEQRNDDRRLFEAKISRLENELRHIHTLNATNQTEAAQLKTEIHHLESTQAKMKEIAQVQLNELSNLDTSYTKTLFKLEEANRMNSELSIQLHAAQQSLQEAKIQLAVSLQAHESMSKQLALLQEKDANDEREKLYLLASILQNQESRSTTTDKIDDSTTPPPQAPQQTIQAR